MPQEIERKYLVRLEDWKPTTPGMHYRQGYLNSEKERVVRVRIEGDEGEAHDQGRDHRRDALGFEYVIPVDDAAILLDQLCEKPPVDKHRHVESQTTERTGRSTSSTATTKGSSSRRWKSPANPNPSKHRRGSGAKCPAILATSIPTSPATPTKIGAPTMPDPPVSPLTD